MEGTPALVRQLGRVARSLGQSLDRAGVVLQENLGYVERLVPSTRVVPFKAKELQHGAEAFIASTATVVGDVQLGERASAWYGATVRGDGASVTIGRNSAVMDNAVVAAAKGKPVKIGQDVTICPGAVVQSATVGDGAMIGMGAVVLPGATVGPDCFVDAGAVVPAGTSIPAGQLWTGVPAKHLRNLTAEEMSYLRSTAVGTASLGLEHAGQGAKDTAALETDQEIRLLKIEGGFAPNTPVSTPDADVVEYYKLTTRDENAAGLFRDKEFDLSKELAARESEEVAADAAEEQYYAQLARQKRVAEALRMLAAARVDRPAHASKVVADLEARDPEGATMLRGLVARVAATAGLPADSADKSDVLRALSQIAPGSDMASAEDRAKSVAGLFDAVAAHTKAGLGFLAAPGAGAAAAGEAKMQ